MNRKQLLLDTGDLTVARFDHPAHEAHRDPESEVATGWGIAFVRSGAFDVVASGSRTALGGGGVFVTRPGLEFRCVHGDECPDDVCLSIGFSDAVVEEAGAPWTRAPWVARAEPTPRLAFAQARLAAAVARADAIGAERWANDALDALASDVADGRRRGAYRARPGDLDAVVAVCDAVDADPAPRTAIAQRARAVGRTSTQLTHAFRRYTGVSPHRFVITSRLSHAARVLDAGATVSQACYQSGFENLSHFVRTFQRAFGVRASAWRSLGLAERRRKVQDLRGRRA